MMRRCLECAADRCRGVQREADRCRGVQRDADRCTGVQRCRLVQRRAERCIGAYEMQRVQEEAYMMPIRTEAERKAGRQAAQETDRLTQVTHLGGRPLVTGHRSVVFPHLLLAVRGRDNGAPGGSGGGRTRWTTDTERQREIGREDAR